MAIAFVVLFMLLMLLLLLFLLVSERCVCAPRESRSVSDAAAPTGAHIYI